MLGTKVLLKRIWAIPLSLVMAFGALAQVETDAQCEPSALNRLSTENYETSVWFSLVRVRALEDTCVSELFPIWYQNWYRGRRAEMESLIGNHATALSYMEYLDVDRESGQGSPWDFPSPVTSAPAVEYVMEMAPDHQIVMVNERHHASSDRLLTMELLAPLAEQGFKYLAIEAGWNGDIAVGWNGGAPIGERGYPIPVTGYYVNDMVFAQLIREAIKLGYKIIAYEREDGQRNSADRIDAANHRDEREWWQAKNIVERVFDIDSDAKLLVHVGYNHLQETREGDDWANMGHHLRQFTGLDPLTIDQTRYSERSRSELEHPLRKRAAELGLIGEGTVVLVDSGGESVLPPSAGIDLAVLGLATRYADGRPTWMGMGGRRRAVEFDTPECAERTCMVEARRAGFPDEVPFDRVEVVNAGRTTLYLPPDEDMVVDVMELDRSTLATRSLRVPEP